MELQDRKKQWGAKERDSLKGFLKLREEIVIEHNPNLSKTEVQKLALATRGLIKTNICTIVDKYLENQSINIIPNHKTNTCDPMTGNWSEQLIDLKNLNAFLVSNQYQNKISAGFYIDSKGSSMVKFMKIIVNKLIYQSGFNGLFIAPYYIIETNKSNKRIAQELID